MSIARAVVEVLLIFLVNHLLPSIIPTLDLGLEVEQDLLPGLSAVRSSGNNILDFLFVGGKIIIIIYRHGISLFAFYIMIGGIELRLGAVDGRISHTLSELLDSFLYLGELLAKLLGSLGVNTGALSISVVTFNL